MEYSSQRTAWLTILTYVSIGLVIASAIMILAYARPEQVQGNAQKLFYIHLGTFFGSFVLFGAAVFAGIQYLRTRHNRWDDLGLASIEVGLIFSLVTIVSGAAWARPIWNTWWTWDPRLTTVAVMWLTYAAYLMLRAGIEDPDRRRRFAAVYGILAFSSVIFTVIIIRVRPDTIHPVAAGPTLSETDVTGAFDMTPRIVQTLLFSIFTYVLVSIIITWHRIRLENRAHQVQQRKVNLLMNT
ncbi:MAG: cytochrome c biogenesis protein CcsA [Chloroflexi bacterium]|nr:cytochrome c biogenesis protein CcsA [Chloroflexota bacterium]